MTGRGLSRARILTAALELVDSEGLDALSMRRLGERLGVQAMSLYRHVKDKEDLLDGVKAAILGEMGAPPETGSVAARCVAWARSLRAVLLSHPNTIPLFTSRPVKDPVALQAVEGALRMLTDVGLDDRQALVLYQTLLAFVLGACVLESTPRAPVAVPAEVLDHPALPTLRKVAEAGRRISPEMEFEAGLETLAAGIHAVYSGEVDEMRPA
ncbi:MAG: TetR/AcrR family transcriptional regulator C-terminal domain-containing protein [Myxococcota bacterium]